MYDNKAKVLVGVQMGMKICLGLEVSALFFKSPTNWKIDFYKSKLDVWPSAVPYSTTGFARIVKSVNVTMTRSDKTEYACVNESTRSSYGALK